MKQEKKEEILKFNKKIIKAKSTVQLVKIVLSLILLPLLIVGFVYALRAGLPALIKGIFDGIN